MSECQEKIEIIQLHQKSQIPIQTEECSQSKSRRQYLVTSKYSERLHHLFCRIRVGRLPGHEVQESLKCHESHVVRIDGRHDPSEIRLTLKQRLKK